MPVYVDTYYRKVARNANNEGTQLLSSWCWGTVHTLALIRHLLIRQCASQLFDALCEGLKIHLQDLLAGHKHQFKPPPGGSRTARCFSEPPFCPVAYRRRPHLLPGDES